MGLDIYMALWSFSALLSKEFWKPLRASTKNCNSRVWMLKRQGKEVCSLWRRIFHSLMWLSFFVIWRLEHMVLWGLQLCWGLREDTRIWLVNTLGRKGLDSYWLTYRSSAGSAMGGNIYFTHILYGLGGIRGNSIRKWWETFKTLI